jgi:hypothetical protein
MDDRSKQIDQILDSLEGVKRAQAPDFFYTRLVARMDNQYGRNEAVRPWFLKPVYALPGLLLVVLINAFALLRNDTGQELAKTTDPDSVQLMASEYHLNDNSLYDLTQDNK